MEPQERTLNLQAESHDLHEQMEDLERQIEERVTEAESLEGSDAEEDRERFEQLDAEVSHLEAQLAGVRGYANAVDRAIDEWDGTEVVLKELSGQETRIVSAEAQRRADRLGVGEERAGEIRDIEFLKRATVATPADAPDPENIHGLPNLLFDYLLSRANALNSVGEFDMGNSSLRQRLTARRGES